MGEKSKSVSFSRVYVCVKAKLTLVSFFFTFFHAPFPYEKVPKILAGPFLAPPGALGAILWPKTDSAAPPHFLRTPLNYNIIQYTGCFC